MTPVILPPILCTASAQYRLPTLHTALATAAIAPPSYCRIMARPNKHKQSNKEFAKGRERKSKVRKIQEEREWEPSEIGEDFAALGLLQRGAGPKRADSASDSESE